MHAPDASTRPPPAASDPSAQPDQRSSVWRTGLLCVTYVAAWTALDVAAGQFQAAEGVSVWYPPAALDFVLLLVFGLRFAPVLLVTSAVHSLWVSPVGLSVPEAAAFGLITTTGYVALAAMLLLVVRIDPRLPSLRDVAWFVALACGLGPLVIALLQVTLLVEAGILERGDLLVSIAGYWAGTATGVGMLSPVLLIAARRLHFAWRDRPALSPDPATLRPRPLELLGQAGLLAATTWAAYGRGAGGSLDFTYFVFVPGIWIAVRGGLPAAALGVLAANTAAALLNGGRVPDDGGIALQFGLVTMTLAGLLLGALITQRRRDTERHRHDALHDALTGLPNRTSFAERLDAAVSRRDRPPDRTFAVLFLDLDRFKTVNDSLGHAAGDELLRGVAARLRAAVGQQDDTARLGGDEFAVLLEGLGDERELRGVVDALRSTVDEPYRIGSASVTITASVGSVAASAQASTPEELLRAADVALHHAKRTGSSAHVVFDSLRHGRAAGRLEMENELREAIEHDGLQLAYQPVLALPGRNPVAAEALVRWRRRSGEEVPPSTFIPLAEESGLVGALGRWVLERACRQAATWRQAPGLESLRIAVNVSPAELQQPGYAGRVIRTLETSGLAPDALDLEVIETQWLERDSDASRELTELAQTGVRLVVDDFGTGYSSFSYLSQLPIRGLKIDQSFVMALPASADAAAIVRAILAMAAQLELQVTAEGVETPAQLEFLERHACPLVQGYLLGRPGPAAGFAPYTIDSETPLRQPGSTDSRGEPPLARDTGS